MTQTELANAALGHLGVNLITALDERSPGAEAVRRHWDLVRDALLRARAWNFATRRAVLSAHAVPPAFGWTASWQLPGDYLQVLEFNGQAAGTGEAAFAIEGTALLADAAEAQLKYTARMVSVSAWDSAFCDAFALLLAAAIAPGLSTAPGLGERLRERGERAAQQAFGPNNLEQRPRAVPAQSASGFLAARAGIYPQ